MIKLTEEQKARIKSGELSIKEVVDQAQVVENPKTKTQSVTKVLITERKEKILEYDMIKERYRELIASIIAIRTHKEDIRQKIKNLSDKIKEIRKDKNEQ